MYNMTWIIIATDAVTWIYQENLHLFVPFSQLIQNNPIQDLHIFLLTYLT